MDDITITVTIGRAATWGFFAYIEDWVFYGGRGDTIAEAIIEAVELADQKKWLEPPKEAESPAGGE